MSYDTCNPFQVPNIGNTCYISSLLFGLFYTPSNNEYILTKDVSDVNAIYLQEIINHHFVQKIRKSLSVNYETMEQIRFYCKELGWKNDSSDEIFNQQDVSEFYLFLLENLNGTQIKIQIETITECAIKSVSDIGKENDIPYIPVDLPLQESGGIIQTIKIKEMLDNWMSDNIKSVTRKVKNESGDINEQLVNALDVKHITNLPPIIPIAINRFQNIKNDNGEFVIIKNNTHVNIQKKISPFNNIHYSNKKDWEFHAVICHRGETPNSGHYYCIIRDSYDVYYLFDDLQIPCIKVIQMDDQNITNVIKTDCVFILYKQK
jgi:uncharacterized UBP type Zn finger protein